MSRGKLAGAIAAMGAMVVALALAAGPGGGSPAEAAKPGESYEVWIVDQTDSRANYGGFLHVFAGSDVDDGANDALPQTYDLGGQASELCLAKTGANPVRPHMLAFNGGSTRSAEGSRYAILSWVVSGHVTVHDADTREAIACLRTSPGANGARQAHSVWPTLDGEHIIVTNQNGKLIERIRADWDARTFAWEPDAKLDLAAGTTPSGAPRQDPVLRPDNAPICARSTEDDRFAFVSLRGGGAFVVDHDATPISIVAEYDRDHVDDNGCGQMETGGTMYLNAGAGAPGDPNEHKVYAVDMTAIDPAGNPPNTPAPVQVLDRDGLVDAHGILLTKNDKYLLSADRIQNDVTVLDTRKNEEIGRYSLTGPLSADPAPDLMDIVPDSKLAVVALRGPAPLSGGADAIGATPGLGVISLTEGGRDGHLSAIGRTPRPPTDSRPPDPHGLRVRILP